MLGGKTFGTALKRLVHAYRYCIAGSMAAAFALFLPVMMGAVGMAVDVGESNHVQQRLCRALDASALAGASAGTDEVEIIDFVTKFFNKNYPEDVIGVASDLTVTVTDDEVIARASADYNTRFMRVIGRDKITISCQTTVHRNVQGLEVVLVLDVTGSMGSSGITALRNASTTFINTLYDRASDEEFVYVGLVPYTATVNVGSIAPDIVDSLPTHAGADVEYAAWNDNNDPDVLDSDLEWRGCVRARDYPHDTFDNSSLVGGEWEPFWWESSADEAGGYDSDNEWDTDTSSFSADNMNVAQNQCNNRRTPNLGCPEYNPIVPLTNVRSDLLTEVGRLNFWCRGGTLGNLGMAWGYRVLSPGAPFTDGAAYDDPAWKKVAVIMTDGQNQLWKKGSVDGWTSDFSAYGFLDDEHMGDGIDTRGEGLAEANERFLETCSAMRDQGITIYSIVFDYNNDDVDAMFTACAGDADRFYEAPSDSQLVTVFETIAKELSILHITQ